MKPIPERIADVALTQVGVQEEGGNNRGPKVREYQAATWLEPAPWPWCAAFVDWCVMKALEGADPADPLFRGMRPRDWRPFTAGAFDLENWGKKRSLKILNPSTVAKAGDIVIFDMGHCGIVIADLTVHLDTVEGNTGPAGLRDSTQGDGVWRKLRPHSMVRSFVRLELA